MRIVDNLAMLHGNQGADFLGMLLQQLLESKQDLRAFLRWRLTPGRVGILRGLHCAVESCSVCQGYLARHFTRGWIKDICPPGATRYHFTSDEVPEGRQTILS